MTDQNIPAGLTPKDAKKAREWALHALNKPGASTTAEKAAARVILNAVPTPTPPTLADMTDEERAACQWMLCDVEDHSRRYVIANPSDEEGDAALIAAEGEIAWIFPEYVTPRPDLPRMAWPGTEKVAPALPDGWRLADHQKYGRVIVTTPTPHRDGRVYFVIPAVNPLGHDWFFCATDELAYIDQGPPMPLTNDQAEVLINDRWNLPPHRTEAGYPNCSTCDGGGCPDCTDPA